MYVFTHVHVVFAVECLDIVDIRGNLQKVNTLAITTNVSDLLNDRDTYIPVTFQISKYTSFVALKMKDTLFSS